MNLRKHSILLVGLLLVVLVGAFVFVTKNTSTQAITSFDQCVAAGNPILESYPPKCQLENGTSFTQDIGNELDLSEMIVSENPRPNQVVTSPLMLKGRARGNYFFEASFPATLLDADGKVLAEGFVTAEGEWMTEDFVPYSGELTFTPTTETGTLLLMRNNPSDKRENDMTLEIPVVF